MQNRTVLKKEVLPFKNKMAEVTDYSDGKTSIVSTEKDFHLEGQTEMIRDVLKKWQEITDKQVPFKSFDFVGWTQGKSFEESKMRNVL